MTEIFKCDLCGASAGNDPYHATIDENGHVHICDDCFDPEHYDLGVLWRKRERMLAKLNAVESRLHEVSVFCATIEQQHNQLLEALIGLLCEAEVIARVMPAYGESQNIKNARAAIAKAKGAV